MTFIHKLGIAVWAIVAAFFIWMALAVETIPLLERIGLVAFVAALPAVFIAVARFAVVASPIMDRWLQRAGVPRSDPSSTNRIERIAARVQRASDELIERSRSTKDENGRAVR